ncbi:hypothetical protein Ple7327_2063 [Pleurocapsa sp. PCC 7327]|uniref:hypothetical protein n=1 Tax=Pleurocapsa sp. PCC 7327 TaxID=118163 RepID=UPI00029FC666|nr:hypothetical protein [Pleurocapsa sp. PCC 7327]AFY77392.1 hypothetical protein Ple7327_2063 [Pleurocapsa sp. PCC 7327]
MIIANLDYWEELDRQIDISGGISMAQISVNALARGANLSLSNVESQAFVFSFPEIKISRVAVSSSSLAG